MSKEIENHILEAFEIKQFLGSGAYGFVWKVIYKETGKAYALKKIFDAFQNDVDAQRTYRQVTILHQLSHDNIIKLQWVIKAHNGKDLYLVFEYMETDLHLLIGQNILGETHIYFIIYQLCKVLKYLHSAQLIHRDLKTSNILINSKCEIKLCDFGLVRSLTYQEDSHLVLTQDVATRWYRSPEMLLSCKQYNSSTDMWSVGCILAEMIIGQPLFRGTSNINQMERILQFTGIPSKQTLKNMKCEDSSTFINQFNVKKKGFRHLFRQCNQNMKNLLLRLLQFDPTKRISAEQVLSLPFFKEFRKSKEKKCLQFVMLQLDDNKRLDLEQYRKIIYKDIERRYPNFNRVTPMPRIYRTHHSCNVKDYLEESFVKKVGKSLLKINHSVHNSSSSFLKGHLNSHMSTHFTETPSPTKIKKQPKILVSIHKNGHDGHKYQKQNNYVEHESMGSKIFKRKAKRIIWKKDNDTTFQ